MNVNLEMELREGSGSRDACNLRASGFVPAVIYGSRLLDSPNMHVYAKSKDVQALRRSGHLISTNIQVLLQDGSKFDVIVKDIQFHHVCDSVMHMDLYRVADDPFVLNVKLNFVDHELSPGIKRGGMLHILRRNINVVCQSVSYIVSSIDISVADKVVGDLIYISDIKWPSGMMYKSKSADGDKVPVARVIGKRVMSDVGSSEQNPDSNTPESLGETKDS